MTLENINCNAEIRIAALLASPGGMICKIFAVVLPPYFQTARPVVIPKINPVTEIK